MTKKYDAKICVVKYFNIKNIEANSANEAEQIALDQFERNNSHLQVGDIIITESKPEEE